MDGKQAMSLKLRVLSTLLFSIVGTALFVSLPMPLAAQGILGDAPEVAQPDATVRLLVKWQGETQIASTAGLDSVQSMTTLWPLDWQVLEVSAAEAERVLASLSEDPRVADVTVDYPLELAYAPNDPGYATGEQWNMDKIGADIAWEFSTGEAITVAVVDSGIDPNHPDLAGQLIQGHNFFDDSTDTTDLCGHGTHVAGIVAAAADNAEGVAGLAYNAALMPVKVINDTCTGSYSRLMQGIVYAVEHGARIIVITSGGSFDHTGVHDAIKMAREQGVLVVVAAGNRNSAVPFYPGSFEESFTVSGTDPNDARYSNSNFGNQIDVAAPATTIFSTYYKADVGSTYAYMTGTSMAAPHVAGLAALILAAAPDTSLTDLEAVLRQTADDLGPAGWDANFGWGRVNAWRAVTAVIPPSGAASNIKAGNIRVPVLAAFADAGVTVQPAASGLRLNWTVDQPNEALSAVIYRATVPAFEASQDIAEVALVSGPGSNHGSYIDTDVTADTTYYYWIVQAQGNVELAVTNPVSGMIAEQTPEPTAPSTANIFLPLLATPMSAAN